MPFMLIFIGLLVFVTGLQNTYRETFQKLSDTMVGDNSFIYWMISILFVGSLGYFGSKSKPFKGLSRLFIALIIVSMVLSNRNNGLDFFSLFVSQVKEGTEKEVDFIGAPLPAPSSGGGGGDGGGDLVDAGVSAGISYATGGLF